MIIKKKKINPSYNDDSWTRIQEYLSSKGYICTGSNGDIQVWVDRIGNGRTIHYYHSQDPSPSTFSDHCRARLPFDIMCTRGRYPDMVYTRAATIDQAVERSKDNACH